MITNLVEIEFADVSIESANNLFLRLAEPRKPDDTIVAHQHPPTRFDLFNGHANTNIVSA
jgi:hypothetical protein